LTIQRKRVAKRLASGLLAGALALGGLAISGGNASAKTPDAETTKRIAGDDRYETAVEIARKGGTTAADNGLVIASGESPYDSLAASALAGYKSAPILLVKSDSLPESVADFLSDYSAKIQASLAKTIYIVGGTSAVSDSVVDAIKAIVHSGDLTPITVTRLAGANRYETAQKISEVPGLMDKDDRLILVNGTDGKWADALSAATLAAYKGWPIVLTDGTGLGTAGGAVVDAYQALAGSSDQYLIVGGQAVMSSAIEGALDALSVPMGNVDRRGGADRWHTNYLLNLYILNSALLGEDAASVFDGKRVAMVSGVAPWDALAAAPWAANASTPVHMVLTPPTSVTPYAAGLVTFLSGAADLPNEVWLIGGKNAVSNSIRDAVVATAQGTNSAGPSLSGCEAGRTSVTAVFPDALSGAESTKVTTSASNEYWSLNAVKDSVTDFMSGGAQLATKANGSTLLNTTYSIATTTLAVGDVVKFHGFPEVAGASSAQKRTVGDASCTVTADSTAPSMTIKAVRNAAGKMDHFIVTLSEALAPTYNASLSVATNWKIGGTALVQYTNTLSATAVDSLGLVYRVSIDAGSTTPTLGTGDVVSYVKTSLKDKGGNFALTDPAGAAGLDAVNPTMSLSAPVCNATANSYASWTNGDLTVRAKLGAELGALAGSGANAYKLRVVNSRGLTIPTVVVDAAASLITITLDVNYHTPADVATAAKNQFATGNFAFTSGGSTKLSATLVDAAPTKGTNDCVMTLTYSEPSTIANASLTVDGIVTTIDSGANNSLLTATKIYFKTTGLKGSSVALAGDVTDAEQTTAQTNSTSASTTLP